jgi:inositol 1,4,5-triphosphate receptor type 1/inositol 1,4,5-triphosphate receptor type 3
LNIFIILSFYDGDPNQSAEERYFERIYKPRLVKELTTDETERLFRICGIIMIVCSTFVVLFFLCKKAPLYVREAWNQSKDLMLSNQGWVINTLLQLFTVGHCIVKVLLNIDVMYYLAYGTLAFIATMVHPFFFAFHLSEVVIRYPTLRNIIKSFWEPKVTFSNSNIFRKHSC